MLSLLFIIPQLIVEKIKFFYQKSNKSYANILEVLMESIGYTTVAAFIIYHYIRLLMKKPREINVKIKPWRLHTNQKATIN